MNRVTPNNIEHLDANQIFVFGSNMSGKHFLGAAKTARKWGAVVGCYNGIQGRTYAIPTKDRTIKKALSIIDIKLYVDIFIDYAITHDKLDFLVTPIGCGWAAYDPKDIAPLFGSAVHIENIFLPQKFWDVLEKRLF